MKRALVCWLLVLGGFWPTLAGELPQIGSREGYLPVPGGKIWYRMRGADKSQPALIALHGGPGASHLCFEVLDPLA
jgi:hypothetical protein